MPAALSTILVSSIISELDANADFAALTASEKLEILNSAQQELCELFNAAKKPNYRSSTLTQPA